MPVHATICASQRCRPEAGPHPAWRSQPEHRSPCYRDLTMEIDEIAVVIRGDGRNRARPSLYGYHKRFDGWREAAEKVSKVGDESIDEDDACGGLLLELVTPHQSGNWQPCRDLSGFLVR